MRHAKFLGVSSLCVGLMVPGVKNRDRYLFSLTCGAVIREFPGLIRGGG